MAERCCLSSLLSLFMLIVSWVFPQELLVLLLSLIVHHVADAHGCTRIAVVSMC